MRKRILRAGIGGALVVTGSTLGLVGLLQIDAVGTRVARAAVGVAAPQGWTVAFDRVSGSWLRSLKVSGIRVVAPSLGVDARVDSLLLRYRLLTFRPRRVVLDSVRVVAPQLQLATAPAGDEPAPPEDEAPPFTFGIGGLSLEGGAVRVTSGNGEPDFLLNPLAFTADGLRTGSEPGLARWSLRADFQPGGLEPGWGRVSGAGGLSDGVLAVDSLRIRSPRSRVEGALRWDLDAPWTRPGAVRWQMAASPLSLSDLRGLTAVPGVLEGDSLFLESSARQVGDSSRVTLSARSNHGARVAAELVWGRGEETLGGAFGLEVREVELDRYLDPAPAEAPLAIQGEGTFRAVMEGETLRTGRAEAALQASAGAERIDARLRMVRSNDPASGPQDSLALSLDAFSWRQLALGPSSANLFRAEGELRWAADLRPVGGGSVAGEGRFQGLEGGAPVRYAGELRLRDLVPPATSSRLRGGLAFRGEGLAPWSARASAESWLGPSTIQGLAVDSAVLHLEWDEGRMALRGEGGTPRGGGRFEASGRVSDSGGRLRLESAEVDSLLPLPATDSAPSVRLAGRLGGEARWSGPPAGIRPGKLSGEFTFRSIESRVGSVRPDSATLRLAWREGRLDGDLRAGLPEGGSVALAVEGTLLEGTSLRLVDGRFRRVDLAALTGGAWETSLTGSFSGSWRQAAPGTAPQAEARLSLEPSALLGDTVRAAAAELHLTQDSLWTDFRAALGGGEIRGTAAADVDPERRRVRGSVRAELPALGGFLGQPDSAVALRGEARLRARPQGEIQDIQVELAAARGWGARVDTLSVAGRLDPDGLWVDTVEARADVLTLNGGGWLPRFLVSSAPRPDGDDLPANSVRSFVLEAFLPDSVVPLALGGDSLVARSGEARLETRCGTSSCRISGDANVASLSRGNLLAAFSEISFQGDLESGRRLSELEAEGHVQGIRTLTAQVRDLRVSARLDDMDLSLELSSDIDDFREARLALDADLRPEDRRVTLRDFFFRMDADRWRLRDPATLRWQGSDLTLDPLAVVAGDQRVEAQGRWSEVQGHDFRVRLDSVRVGTLSDLLGAPGLDGWLSGRVDGSGQGPVPELAAEARGSFTFRDRATHGVRLRADLTGDDLTLDAALADSLGAERLEARGSLPLPGNDEGSWDVDITADSLPLGWFEPYAPADVIRGVRGSARARIALRGTGATPTAQGRLGLEGGRFTLPALGITLDRVGGAASIAERTLTVDSLRLRSGGTGTARGTVTLTALSQPLEMDLEVEGRDFVAIDTRMLRSMVNADLSVGGTSVAPEVRGSVEVQEATIRLDEGMAAGNVEQVTLSEEDWDTLQRRYGILRPSDGPPRPPLLEATALELAVTLGRDIWLRQRVNPEMAVQFTGDVQVEKASGEELPRLRGRLEAIPQRSYLEQFGRRFRLEEGTVLLRGAPEDTRVDITSVYQVPPRDGDDSQVSVRLGLAGEVGRLELTLSSDPALSNGDIVSYLATGRPAKEAFTGGEGSSVTELGTNVVASQLTGLVEQFAMSGVGLDVVEIERDGLRSATLVAGRYVTPTLFLGFRQPVSFGQADDVGTSAAGSSETEAQVEWRALRWLLVNLETGGSAFRFFLEGSLGY